MRGRSRAPTRRALYAALLALMFLPGCEWMCGKKKPPQPVAQEAGETPSRVEVLSVGSEPRVKLEVARWSGLIYRLDSETDSSFGVQGAPPAKAPTSLLSLKYEVLRGTADPVIKEIEGRKLRLVQERATLESIGVRSADAPPDLVEKLNLGFSLLKGSTTRQLVTEDGEQAEVVTELVGGMVPPPEIKKLLDGALDSQRHFPFRLPPVAVGNGARWRFSEPIEIRGAKAIQVSDMTLVALSQQTARIAIRVRNQAPRQQIPHPLEPGLSATLEGLRGDADGEITIDRLTACILAARLNGASFLSMTWMDMEGKDQTATFMQASTQRMTGRVGEDDGGVDGGSDAGAEAGGAAVLFDAAVKFDDTEDEP